MEWDLPQLRALVTTVEEGTLEAAARTLHITPSAVSQRLKALERTVGAVLLSRSRPVRVTEAGKPVLQLARQLGELTSRTERALGASGGTLLRLAVNADSLSAWVLEALTPLAATTPIEFVRADQDDTAELLRDGSVMGAITSQARPVQGCRSTRLGTQRYHAVAQADFVARHFTDGVNRASLSAAPVVVFDEHDHLQDTFLRRHRIDPATPPHHVVPATAEFGEAVQLGYGWGMLMSSQFGTGERRVRAISGEPPERAPHVDVTLYWQQWELRTPDLDEAARLIRRAATDALEGAQHS